MRTGSAASGARPPEQGQPHVVDVHVGQRLRFRRKLMGLSQGDLAQRVGLTFQQIQKYERGINRISASRLVEFAAVLKVPRRGFSREFRFRTPEEQVAAPSGVPKFPRNSGTVKHWS
jgi:transcriptional regulator with XRE-family HTH domain